MIGKDKSEFTQQGAQAPVVLAGTIRPFDKKYEKC